uniref:Metallo-beta-lactamase domain-containing protein n=1 Tax=Vannella robusta TaxID=1487602 RepID=A0A7S4M6C7_9EUKA|mmetsp:Transcript_13143/g.16476  ORF Transcript_13143/g.16476 Transcript_13143/m.16476 type:complete len:283 (+) Transcript_13143:91-939(+)
MFARRLVASASMTQRLEDVRKLSDRVICVLGQNPGSHTLQGTNTYLIGTGKKRILLDTGEGKDEYLPILNKVLEQENIEIQEIICTHWHHDHIGGIPQLTKENSIPVSKFADPHDAEFLPDYTFRHIKDSAVFECEGATMVALFTPGHSDDHLSFWFPEENSLFSGDCVLGEGTTAFQNLSQYMKSLEILLEKQPTRIYPGHGPVIEDGVDRIKEYMKHRIQREEQILEVISKHKQSTGDNPSVSHIVSTLYPTIPASVVPSAERNVQLHMDKLIADGRLTI